MQKVCVMISVERSRTSTPAAMRLIWKWKKLPVNVRKLTECQFQSRQLHDPLTPPSHGSSCFTSCVCVWMCVWVMKNATHVTSFLSQSVHVFFFVFMRLWVQREGKRGWTVTEAWPGCSAWWLRIEGLESAGDFKAQWASSVVNSDPR